MKSFKTIDIKNAVINLEIIDRNSFGVIDSENIFRKYSFKTFVKENGFKSGVGELQAYSHQSAIDKLSSGLLFYQKRTKELFYFNRSTQKSKYSIKPHVSALECTHFSPDGKYFLTGGQEGRVYFFDSENGDKVDIFSHHSDSITALDMSKDGRWVASAGYDKVIKVTNRSFRGKPYRLISHKAVPTKIKFLSQQRILSADRDGVLLIWSIVEEQVVKRLEPFKAEVSTFTVSQSGRYLFVCSISGEVALYDLKSYTLVKRHFIKALAGINTIVYHDPLHIIVVGLSNGQIIIYNLKAEEKKFQEFLAQKDYKSCYSMCFDNPLLYEIEAYKELEEIYNAHFSKAQEFLEKDKKAEAQKILEGFTTVVQKRLLIQKLFNDFALYKQFQFSFQSKKFAPAYALAEKYDDLKKTKEYLYMEELWRKTVLIVQKYVHDREYDTKVRALFKPFQGVPGKSIVIHSLIENRYIFSIFLQAIKKKEFHKAFNVVENHSFLKKMPEYETLLTIGRTYEKNTILAFNSGKYHDAAKFCDIVSLFPGRKDFAVEVRDRANIYAETMQYYAEKSMAKVYDMLRKYPYLEDARIAQELEVNYLQSMRSSDYHSKKGDVIGIKKVMRPYYGVKSKKDSIVHIITKAYVYQMTFYIEQEKYSSLQKALDKFRSLFGVNAYLEDFVFKYQDRYTFNFKVNEGQKTYDKHIEDLPDVLV